MIAPPVCRRRAANESKRLRVNGIGSAGGDWRRRYIKTI
jgi:hypothetical protein